MIKAKTGDFKEVDSKYLNVGDIALTSTWYNTIWVGANQLFTTAVASKALCNVSTALATIGSIGVFLDGAASEIATFDIELPKDYKAGTDILPYISFATTTSTGSTGVATIGLAYASVHSSPTTAIVNLTSQEIVVNGSTEVLSKQSTYFAAVTGTDFKAGSIINGCIYRNATAALSTGLVVDLVVHGIGFLYQVDGMGSTYNTIFGK